MATFVNPMKANADLQTFANDFLKNGGSTVNIVISTSNASANTPVNRVGGFANTNALMWGRGLAMQKQLISMGIPKDAFPRNWLQFQFGTKPGVQISGK